MIPHSVTETVLNKIELFEQVALSWGIIDVGISHQEVETYVAEAIESYQNELDLFLSTDDVINHLKDLGLIYLFGAGFNQENGQYRSRMAETVRLAFLLRQQFPKHIGPEKWQTARRLVSDFRFARANRKFPRRTLLASDVSDQLSSVGLRQSHKDCLEKLLASYGQSGFLFAHFQVEATRAISARFKTSQSAESTKPKDHGIIVTAGTGSGKTLSFYLPVLARIASRISDESEPEKYWLQCLAIYPRVELQRDQFRSTLQEARRLSKFLAQNNKRPIRLGLFYGSTPSLYSRSSTEDAQVDLQEKWKKGSRGYVCPHFTCWENGCDKPLIWPFESIKQNKEELICSDASCGNKITSDEIALTRGSIRNRPPDILFTSSEMLNRNLSNNDYQTAFGVRKYPYAPEFLLIDEVHLYSGAYGAQFAYLIRRWRSQLPQRTSISFVGLSATLVDADKFFERLTGLRSGRCLVVSPHQTELEVEGVEYLIALKGDPLSKTALLSTTIQVNMLLSRMLDGTNSEISKGMFGTKLFTFTDDIDVANRLYYYVRDAEGFGFQNQFGTLAKLREPSPSLSKKQEGQDWEFAELISGSLSNGKIVERVSSQDKGLDPNSEIVVATSSLEVGFDDPKVGAVIQHKSPRNLSGFLQRKGRGGRTKKMRPWTSIILSDYGRDRLTFQAYEKVFEPEIEPAILPLESMHIKRIQAAYFVLDFLAKELNFSDEARGLGRGKKNIWNLIRTPSEPGTDERCLQKIIESILQKIVSDQEFYGRFLFQLRKALNLNPIDLDIVMWEQPRPLMTSLIPSILRLIKVELRGMKKQTYEPPLTPLPEFLPSALFSDLNLPELTLIFPTEETQTEKMPILQGLRSFAPGKVSRRFAINYERERHWLEIEDIDSEECIFQINSNAHHFRKIAQETVENNGHMEIFRPISLTLSVPPKKIKDTSNSVPNWQTKFELSGEATNLLISDKHGVASRIFKSVSVHTHSSGFPAKVLRFFNSSVLSLKRKSQSDTFKTAIVKNGEVDAALGYQIETDAMVFEIDFDELLSNKKIIDSYKQKLPQLRTSHYFDAAENSGLLSHIPNPFLRGWIARIFFDALCFEALSTGESLMTSADIIFNENGDYNFQELLEKVFQSIDYSFEEVETNNSDATEFEREEHDFLRDEILYALKQKETQVSLKKLTNILTGDIDEHMTWILEVAATTLSKVIASSIHQLVPHFEESDIIVDVVSTSQEGKSDKLKVQLVVSELSPGGIGHIEKVADTFALDPRMFFQTICSNSGANNHEIVDEQLRSVVEELSVGEAPMNIVFAEYRKSMITGHSPEVRDKVLKELKNSGKSPFHSFLSTLFSRVLRPGSTAESDLLFHKVFDFWRNSDQSLGVEIDSRVISFLFSKTNSGAIDQIIQLMNIQLSSKNRDAFRANVLNSLIWPSGSVIRNLHISAYNPFEPKVPVERIVLEPVLISKAITVDIEEDGWKQHYQSVIKNHGTVNIICAKKNTERISQFLNFVAVEPIYQDYLKVFARISRITQEKKRWKINLDLPEVMQ